MSSSTPVCSMNWFKLWRTVSGEPTNEQVSMAEACSLAVSCAPNKRDPRIQRGTLRPEPGTA
jgi:hypothetical protein